MALGKTAEKTARVSAIGAKMGRMHRIARTIGYLIGGIYGLLLPLGEWTLDGIAAFYRGIDEMLDAAEAGFDAMADRITRGLR